MSSNTHTPHIQTETLVVSDLHLGSPNAKVREFLELLHVSEFKRLILLGDVVHGLDFHRMEQEHWNALGRIRQLTHDNQHKEVIWIAGNHDWRLKPLFTKILGVQILEDFNEFAWVAGGKKFLAVHGHKFDYLYGASKWFQKVSEYGTWLDGKLHLPLWVRRFSRLTHTVGIMEKGAALRAKFIGAQTVLCGHTHTAKKKRMGDIDYINTGSWVHLPCTYVTVSTDGVAELHEFTSTGITDIEWASFVPAPVSASSLPEFK